MKAKTKFIKMYYKLPVEARTELIYDAFGRPRTLRVIKNEIEQDTELGKNILKKLWYKDN